MKKVRKDSNFDQKRSEKIRKRLKKIQKDFKKMPKKILRDFGVRNHSMYFWQTGIKIPKCQNKLYLKSLNQS